jgi:arylformamidase
MGTSFELIDVSHTIEAGMITYKGLPAPTITEHLSRVESRQHYAPGTEFHIGRIEMVANTGTYLDSPFHRYEHGKDLSQLELSSLANLDAVVVDCPAGERAIGPRSFEHLEVDGKAVLFRTGWDAHWRTEEYLSGRHPYLTEEAAKGLVDRNPRLVGIDSYNIDNTETGTRPAHSVLLSQNIPIVEHLCGLNELPRSGFKFFAVPVKIRKFGTFPVRAFALVPKER